MVWFWTLLFILVIVIAVINFKYAMDSAGRYLDPVVDIVQYSVMVLIALFSIVYLMLLEA